MTKTIRDNVSGLEVDADEAVELSMIDRADGKLVKVELDMSRESWLEFYGRMVRKPPYQQWVKHDETEKKETGKTGHWQKLK